MWCFNLQHLYDGADRHYGEEHCYGQQGGGHYILNRLWGTIQCPPTFCHSVISGSVTRLFLLRLLFLVFLGAVLAVLNHSFSLSVYGNIIAIIYARLRKKQAPVEHDSHAQWRWDLLHSRIHRSQVCHALALTV